jgi:hypothetical protein
MMMINESPEEKLQVTTGLGALLTVTSVVICTLCDKDPWGEASSLDIIAQCSATPLERRGPMHVTVFGSLSWAHAFIF